jgi:hypothetical protein
VPDLTAAEPYSGGARARGYYCPVMLTTIAIENFGDTFIVVAAISTAFMAGAMFGFRQAIKAVRDYEG